MGKARSREQNRKQAGGRVRLLRIYPRAWRARYGDELATLIEELEAGGRLTWRARLDLVRAGVVERVRALGPGGVPPRDRAREGALIVLYAWMVFAIAGFGVQKASEHWRAATPTAERGLPSAAFDVLVVAAAVGAALVVLAVALSLPRLAALIHERGWVEIRRPIVRAALLSVLTVAATLGLGIWAHSLTPLARNGGDAAYSWAFAGWVVLVAAALLAWAAAAAAAARLLAFSARLIHLEVWLGVAVSAAMTIVTVATGVWWGSLASAAPWFFDGRSAGSGASALQWNIAVPAALMLGATSLGLIGAIRATRALAEASVRPQIR